MKKSELDKMAEILEGVAVYGVFSNWSAAQAGVQKGDIILKVNNIRTKTTDDYFHAAKLDSDKRDIVVWRNGKKLELSINVKKRVYEKELSSLMEESGINEFLLEEEKTKELN